MPYPHALLFALLILCVATSSSVRARPAETANSVGMRLVHIPAGQFEMGSNEEFDEQPMRSVRIEHSFEIGVTEVTNAQYEMFAPTHRAMRGYFGFSRQDDEAVVFVSWEEAQAFCQWLGKREGKSYRLPTEAEWEYAARAGTTTRYHTGDTLPQELSKNATNEKSGSPVSLRVGRLAANAWGLHDVHGNVEEWCDDFYAPYDATAVRDPRGPADGIFRVTRGGSYGAMPAYLRSANRLAALPTQRNSLIGFRVVCAPIPRGDMAAPAPLPRWGEKVSQTPAHWPAPIATPHFAGPIPFVKVSADSNGPIYAKHNHCPSVVVCPNGDLLATWYSTNTEPGRELTVLAARLRFGTTEWDEPSVFFKAADRNMHATSLLADRDGRLWHFQGMAASDGWGNLQLYFRTSDDNGATWTTPKPISETYGPRHMPIAGPLQLANGAIVVPCDAVPGPQGGTAVWITRDGGATWDDPGTANPTLRPAVYDTKVSGGSIAGIHAGVVELKDGRLFALGRQDSIDGKMPASESIDVGRTWTYRSSEFPPIGGGQRLALRKLDDGSLFLASFTGEAGLDFPDAAGGHFVGYGLFAAISFDDGKTWPLRKLITPGVGSFEGRGWTGSFQTDAAHAEPKGYLAATQTPDGVIHLLSSGLHYEFNAEWLKAMPATESTTQPTTR